MPKLSEHSSGELVKLLFIGNGGTGKTGAMASLIAAGYHLHIIDLDNGLDALKNHALDQGLDLDLVDYETFKDKIKFTQAGPKVSGPATAAIKTANLLDEWTDGTNPADWGPRHILVIDSLTALGAQAYHWAQAQNPGYKNIQLWYREGQNLIENIIDGLCNDSFRTNVIVISHIDYRQSEETGSNKGFVSALGKALGPKLPRYFNTMILAESSGQGKKTRRMIKTFPTGVIDLKNPAPMRIEAEYPLETGLATVFEKLKEQ